MTAQTGLDTLGEPENGDKGFRMKPGSPFHIRDYSNEPVGRLKALYVLVDAIMERYPELVPGSLNRLMRLWRADLSKAILAKDPSTKDGEVEAAQDDETSSGAEAEDDTPRGSTPGGHDRVRQGTISDRNGE